MTRLVDRLDGHDDAVHLHDAHAGILINGTAVGATCFPVITIDGNSTIAAGLDTLTHPTLLANHGLDIAQAFAVRFVKLPQ